MVEHSAVNRRVVGSNPTRGATSESPRNAVRCGGFSLAVWAGLSLVVVPAGAGATVAVEEPSPNTISTSDIICLARVDRVLGAAPFTNRNPPDVFVTVQDGIKGTQRGETLQILGWVTGAPHWSDVHGLTIHDIRLWESRRTVPPAIGARLLLFLERSGQHQAKRIQGSNGPVFIASPDARTIETVRGAAWLDFTIRPIPKSPRHPVTVGGILTNHSPDSMSFDLRHALTHGHMPTVLEPGERWRPHPPPPIRLGPGERRAYSFPLRDISPVPIGVPGPYSFDIHLPANVNGQGSYLSVAFRIDGEIRLRDAAACSWMVFAAAVDSIFPFRPDLGPAHWVSLIDHRFLHHEPHGAPRGYVLSVDWHRDLPLRPIPGRRYIFFLDRQGRVFHVAEMNSANLRSVEAGLAWVEQIMQPP